MFEPLNPNCVVCLEDTCLSNGNSSNATSLCDMIEFVNYLKLPIYDEVQQRKISISICVDCEDIMKTFSATLKSLRVAQMKLDSCLKQIQDKMLNKSLSEVEDSNNSDDEVTNLRKKLIEKSSILLKRSESQPVVMLMNASPQPQLTATSEQRNFVIVKTEPDLFKSEVEDNDYEHEDVYQMEVDDRSVCVAETGADSAKIKTGGVNEVQLTGSGTSRKKKKLKHKPCQYCRILLHPKNIAEHEIKCEKNRDAILSKGDGKSPYISCPFCRAEFEQEKPKSGQYNRGAWMLRQHLLQYHGAHYFPTQKHESITDSEYQKVLVELLFEGLVEGKESCAFCPRTFSIAPKGSKKSAYHLRNKLHYVDAHHKNLEERLNDIQNDPCLKEKLRKCNPKGRECKQCGTYLTNHSSGVAHRKLHCNRTEKQEFIFPRTSTATSIEERLPVLKTEDASKVKCKQCGNIIGHAWATQHVKKYCKVLKG